MRVFRICKPEHAANAYHGVGSQMYPGRWHSRGVRVVYTLSSLSLAQLEYRVHRRGLKAPPPVVLVTAEVPDNLIHDLPAELPDGWADDPECTRSVGDVWAAARTSVGLSVPSVLSPGEFNLLLNPRHPEFAQVSVGAAEPFAFDTRLFGG